MAKARYSMGPLSVNPLHYDTIMTATCLVEVETATCSPKTDGDETTEIDERVTSSVFRVYRYNTANVVIHTIYSLSRLTLSSSFHC